jgi:hypothetical protein
LHSRRDIALWVHVEVDSAGHFGLTLKHNGFY